MTRLLATISLIIYLFLTLHKSTSNSIFLDKKNFLSHLHKTNVPIVSVILFPKTRAKCVDNVYNLVYKSLLSCFRCFCLWITFYSIALNLWPLFRLFLLFCASCTSSKKPSHFRAPEYFDNSLCFVKKKRPHPLDAACRPCLRKFCG